MDILIRNKGAIAHHLIWPIGIGLFSAVMKTQEPLFPTIEEIEGRVARSLFAWMILLGATTMINHLVRRKFPLILRLCLAVVIVGVPISFFVPWLTYALGLVPGRVVFPSIEANDILADFPGLYILVLQITCLSWIAGNYQRYRRIERLEERRVKDRRMASTPAADDKIYEQTSGDKPVEAVSTSQKPVFLKKLTKKIGNDVIALKSEQHYLRVYTSEGNDLILYRLSDAITELEGWDKAGDGLQVHRSYWVAKFGIQDIQRAGKLATIILSNGEQIPVSRNRVKSLKEAGWL